MLLVLFGNTISIVIKTGPLWKGHSAQAVNFLLIFLKLILYNNAILQYIHFEKIWNKIAVMWCYFLKKDLKVKKNLMVGFAALVGFTLFHSVKAIEMSSAAESDLADQKSLEKTLQQVVAIYAETAKLYVSGDLDPRAKDYISLLHDRIRKGGGNPCELSLSHFVTDFARSRIQQYGNYGVAISDNKDRGRDWLNKNKRSMEFSAKYYSAKNWTKNSIENLKSIDEKRKTREDVLRVRGDKRSDYSDRYWSYSEKLATIAFLYQKQFRLDKDMSLLAGLFLEDFCNVIYNAKSKNEDLRGYLHSFRNNDTILKVLHNFDEPQSPGGLFTEMNDLVNKVNAHDWTKVGKKESEERGEFYDEMLNFTKGIKDRIVDRQKNIEKSLEGANKQLEQLDCESVKIMAERMYSRLDNNYSAYSIIRSDHVTSKFANLLSERRLIRDKIDHICTDGISNWGQAMLPKNPTHNTRSGIGGGDDADKAEAASLKMRGQMNVQHLYDSTLYDPLYENGAISFDFIAPSPDGPFSKADANERRNPARMAHREYSIACLKGLPDGYDLSYQTISSKDESDQWHKDPTYLNIGGLELTKESLIELGEKVKNRMEKCLEKMKREDEPREKSIKRLEDQLKTFTDEETLRLSQFQEICERLLKLQNFLKGECDEKGIKDPVKISLSMVDAAYNGDKDALSALNSALDGETEERKNSERERINREQMAVADEIKKSKNLERLENAKLALEHAKFALGDALAKNTEDDPALKASLKVILEKQVSIVSEYDKLVEYTINKHRNEKQIDRDI